MKSTVQSCSLQLRSWSCHPLCLSIVLYYCIIFMTALKQRSGELKLSCPSKWPLKVSQLINNFLEAVTSVHRRNNKGSVNYLKTFVLFSGCIYLGRKRSQRHRTEKCVRSDNVSCSLGSKLFWLSFPSARCWAACGSSACLSLTSHLQLSRSEQDESWGTLRKILPHGSQSKTQCLCSLYTKKPSGCWH